MTGLALSCVFVVVLTLQICPEVRSGGIQGGRPYEERVANFRNQNVRNAIDIKGKVFVIKRNYRTSSRHRCLYSQRTERYSKTMYKFTLGSTPPYSRMYLVKFKTALQILKTGKHDTYNAVKYKIRPHDPHKVRKLMYVDKKASCIIFVDNRGSESEKARCQLMRPARYADQPLPEQCQRVYKQNCHGESIKLYRRWCQSLP
uniref:Salivary lipocalin n=1 Tax=Amblyomma variegatum TaxID=34610 RepID=F0JA42_AMBVA|nr:TPA_inf: salivary lipocalin [Amblyomma variegatum]